jgi:hypothetical protein
VQVVQEVAQVLALLDLGGQPGRRLVLELSGLLAPRAEHRQAAVARDRVQPGLELDLAVVGEQARVGRGEGVLDSVLGLVARAEHVAAEGEDAAVVAVVGHLERDLVAAPDLLDQSLVAEGGEKAP